MSQFASFPVLLPLFSGILLLLLPQRSVALQRAVSLLLTVILLGMSVSAFQLVLNGDYHVILLGDWSAPFGIVMVLDSLSALMLVVTATLAVAALWYAIASNTDQQGKYFHVLFQLQLFGLNGAFMTGDLFNLFVFFEVLLLASYGLLLHGGGRLRTRAGLHYVVLNLIGSTLFLFAVGTLYGMLGTLNIADMAIAVQAVDAEDRGIVSAAALMLLLVFGIKAAIFPVYLWLPGAYTYTTAPVAALFAIMTKVGLYAMIRVHGTLFSEDAGMLAFIHHDWLLALGLLTLLLGAFGVLAARIFRQQVAYLVLASVATLMVAIGLTNETALSAGLYYLIHSTLIGAALFLLADVIRLARGHHADTFTKATPLAQPVLVGSVFMLLAVAVAGMPPLSGFFGKLMLLHAALAHHWYTAIATIILTSGLIMIVALVRTGSLFFYSVQSQPDKPAPALNKPAFAAIIGLLLVSPAMVLLAQPLTTLTTTIATQTGNHQAYINAVMRQPEKAAVMP
ncbi:Na(+) H(+) antiporter subunit D [Methylophaga frappieri]|uniref:Na(+) H(+) antiporter subunit D n=1 Tax=Methylophaga frappieri (strain ATCC BAA-2434 / DSM 25690 / JAM7) TaxID=754477 RepID=I1YH77_METFJ|nr:monovalent cation/H+ antiporter subunit D [Methylophaga frappieri]AFJ02270.1 Na(+) H(+) antiporter subunit D [Methylophaga frappieri]